MVNLTRANLSSQNCSKFKFLAGKFKYGCLKNPNIDIQAFSIWIFFKKAYQYWNSPTLDYLNCDLKKFKYWTSKNSNTEAWKIQVRLFEKFKYWYSSFQYLNFSKSVSKNSNTEIWKIQVWLFEKFKYRLAGKLQFHLLRWIQIFNI